MLVRICEAFLGILLAAATCVLVHMADVCAQGIPYLSEQYRIELLGVMICFSQTVLFIMLACVG